MRLLKQYQKRVKMREVEVWQNYGQKQVKDVLTMLMGQHHLQDDRKMKLQKPSRKACNGSIDILL